MKIAYIGIDLMIPVLKMLVDFGCEVLEIFTCKTDNFTEFNTEIVRYAESHEIQYTVERITKDDFSRLKSKGCEAVICAGYYHKIPVCEDVPTVNVHPSYLPYGKGSWPMPYYILDRKKNGGISVHKIAEGFDEGDILFRREFPLTNNDNLQTYMEKAMSAIEPDLKKLSDNFLNHYNSAFPQENGGCYLETPTKDMFTVDASTDVTTADRVFRAFYGYECYYRDGIKEYILIKPKAVNKSNYKSDGNTVAFVLDGGFAVCKKEHVYLVN